MQASVCALVGACLGMQNSIWRGWSRAAFSEVEQHLGEDGGALERCRCISGKLVDDREETCLAPLVVCRQEVPRTWVALGQASR